MTFIEKYLELFSGTKECYAICRDWEQDGERKRAYLPSNYSGEKPGVRSIVEEVVSDVGSSEFGIEAVKAHLTGSHFLGVYPIRADSTVVFFALDFDKDEAEARIEARRQQKIFELDAGIQTYIERSRSGNGYHLWGFLEEPINAGRLRFALAPYIEDTDTYDRMFPNQDGTTETKPYGNLIALPLYGPNVKELKGVFLEVDDLGTQYFPEDQKAFVQNIQLIPKAKIEELFTQRKEIYTPDLGGRKRKGDPEALDGLYKVIHPELGCEWIRWCIENQTEVSEPEWYALACQFAQLNGGRDAFHDASREDPRYDPKVTDEKFDHALAQNSPHTCQYIRDNLKGPPCTCDQRFHEFKVTHPYDLAKVPFHVMLEQLQLELEPEEASSGLMNAIEHVTHVFKNPGAFEGIEYGLPSLDKHTELRPNDLIIFAARPGRGKSAFLIDLAYELALGGTHVYIYSMEMSRDQFWMRLLSRAAQVDGKRLAKGTLLRSEWKRIIKVKRSLAKNPLPIFIDDTTYDATDLVNKAADQIASNAPAPAVVMIDYAQMATNKPQESNYEKNSRVAREYKLLAKAMHVPVFCLAQMNREGEDLTEDSDTVDTVIEGSGKWEQYADVIMFLLGPRSPGIVRRVLVVHKERYREAGHRIPLDFNQSIMMFEEQGTWAAKAQAIQVAQIKAGKDFFA